MIKKTTLVFSLLFLFFTTSKISSAQESIPAELDFKTRHATRRLIEFEPFIGEYLGNYLNNSLMGGARLGFRVTEAISLGVEFNYNRIQFDPTSNLGRSINSRNQYITDFYFTYAFPVLQRAGKTVQEMDLFTTVGVGHMRINSKDRIVGVIGGGLKIFFNKPRWLALRFDVNTYMYSIPRLTDSKFADDWTFSIGPSFLFLPKK
ncbi:MAG: hypothetical protein JNK65_06745 [Deltaproteobacteria bacterium]|nr:hypothetical protein [Deltaproteobacteria bacterium]